MSSPSAPRRPFPRQLAPPTPPPRPRRPQSPRHRARPFRRPPAALPAPTADRRRPHRRDHRPGPGRRLARPRPRQTHPPLRSPAGLRGRAGARRADPLDLARRRRAASSSSLPPPDPAPARLSSSSSPRACDLKTNLVVATDRPHLRAGPRLPALPQRRSWSRRWAAGRPAPAQKAPTTPALLHRPARPFNTPTTLVHHWGATGKPLPASRMPHRGRQPLALAPARPPRPPRLPTLLLGPLPALALGPRPGLRRRRGHLPPSCPPRPASPSCPIPPRRRARRRPGPSISYPPRRPKRIRRRSRPRARRPLVGHGRPRTSRPRDRQPPHRRGGPLTVADQLRPIRSPWPPSSASGRAVLLVAAAGLVTVTPPRRCLPRHAEARGPLAEPPPRPVTAGEPSFLQRPRPPRPHLAPRSPSRGTCAASGPPSPRRPAGRLAGRSRLPLPGRSARPPALRRRRTRRPRPCRSRRAALAGPLLRRPRVPRHRSTVARGPGDRLGRPRGRSRRSTTFATVATVRDRSPRSLPARPPRTPRPAHRGAAAPDRLALAAPSGARVPRRPSSRSRTPRRPPRRQLASADGRGKRRRRPSPSPPSAAAPSPPRSCRPRRRSHRRRPHSGRQRRRCRRRHRLQPGRHRRPAPPAARPSSPPAPSSPPFSSPPSTATCPARIAQVSRDVYDLHQRNVVLARGAPPPRHLRQPGRRRPAAPPRRLEPPPAPRRHPPRPPRPRPLQGADATGAAGLPAQVHNHILRVFGDAILLSILAAGADLSQPASTSALTAPRPAPSPPPPSASSSPTPAPSSSAATSPSNPP